MSLNDGGYTIKPAATTFKNLVPSVYNSNHSQIASFSATGGDQTYDDNINHKRIHIFRNSGHLICTGTGDVEVLVVGGGGGGGGAFVGGGGGGGGLQTAAFTVNSEDITVTVGNGGVGGIGYYSQGGGAGSNGENSVFKTTTAYGGGGGGEYAAHVNGLNGGCGGGASYQGTAGTGSQGYNGGSAGTSPNRGGGGGGMGGAGGSGSPPNGGPGLANSISGSSITYSGGGGGGSNVGGGGGGSAIDGGGAAGNAGGNAAVSGENGRGGGGGGACGNGYGNEVGGNGGSGIVIVSYSIGLAKSSQGNNGVLAEESVPVPTEYGLSQNYPNPFNPTTVISYQLPGVGTRFIVSLKVYDILGREVVTLIDGIKEAGYYSTMFDASRLASGIYFARVIASPENGNKPFTKIVKMLLMK
jgi:hypothetical protein